MSKRDEIKAGELSSEAIEKALEEAYAAAKAATGGENASYIPALAQVPSDLIGVAAVTADGRVFEKGDCDYEFAIESISKVFSMALAMEDVGAEAFHSQVGADPTGMPFNSVMALELHNDLPMSPLVNAGAMSTTSLVKAADKEARWKRILECQSDFAGRQLRLSDEVNTSEQDTNFHNRAIAWLLKCGGTMYSDPMEACEIYTRQCSTLITARDLAVMGATLANRGLNPVTGKDVLGEEHVPHVLSEMVMEGLYTSSGDWAYTVGLPGKSGVGGGILAVSPGKLAFAAFSPPLDEAGNSVRGWAAAETFSKALELNIYA